MRGPTVAPGALAPDGWLHTGDLGALDDGGPAVGAGRRAETIISGGENVAPAEVESVLESHPLVLEAGVFGVADEQWGEAVSAVVVLRRRDGLRRARSERGGAAGPLRAGAGPLQGAQADLALADAAAEDALGQAAAQGARMSREEPR